MRTEVPILRNCCFCVPLRRGLIAWGYFKLTIAWMLLVYFYSQVIPAVIYALRLQTTYHFINLTMFLIIVLLLIVDVIFHFIFLIGVHKRKVKPLRAYYLYSIALLGFTCMLGLLCIAVLIDIHKENDINHYRRVTGFAVLTLLIHFAVHVYVIILVRSQIIKLANVGPIRFRIRASDSECTLILKNSSEVQVASVMIMEPVG